MSVQQEIDALAPWFHNLHLPGGIQTAPDHFLGDFPSFKWKRISRMIPEDLTGWKILDIGCNAGFYAIELARRGGQVTAIDLDEHYLNQAEWAAEKFGVSRQIIFKKMQVYDLATLEEEFDLVWFMGVFYHLRYPMLALDILSRKCSNLLLFQSLSMPGREEEEVPGNIDIDDRERLEAKGFPKMAFIEQKLAGDPTNWWVPNTSAVKAMLRSCGFEITGNPDDETYLAKKDFLLTDQKKWNYSEYLSATGKDWQKEISLKTRK